MGFPENAADQHRRRVPVHAVFNPAGAGRRRFHVSDAAQQCDRVFQYSDLPDAGLKAF